MKSWYISYCTFQTCMKNTKPSISRKLLTKTWLEMKEQTITRNFFTTKRVHLRTVRELWMLSLNNTKSNRTLKPYNFPKNSSNKDIMRLRIWLNRRAAAQKLLGNLIMINILRRKMITSWILHTKDLFSPSLTMTTSSHTPSTNFATLPQKTTIALFKLAKKVGKQERSQSRLIKKTQISSLILM